MGLIVLVEKQPLHLDTLLLEYQTHSITIYNYKSSQSNTELAERKILKSSNNNLLQFMDNGKTLINRRKRDSPRLVPCGTPGNTK